MHNSFRLLLVDDSVDDAEGVVRNLNRAGLEPSVRQVWEWKDLLHALDSESWEFILCDHRLPTFDSSDVLKLLREKGLAEVPFILISGEIDVKTAVSKMHEGACDFLFKDDLSRLAPAIHREREKAQIREEKRQAEQQLRESNHKLRLTLNSLASVQEQLIASERFRALGQMASGIAHDFNNSLAKILGIAELIECTEDPGGKLLAQLKVIVEDAAAVVRRLVDFYRDNPVKEAVPVEISSLLQDVKDFTRPRWQNAPGSGSALIEVAVKHSAHTQALADASQLREMLTNLVFNACDALEQGGLIELISRDAGEFVEIEVKDNGCGMTEEVLKRCLEPLFTTKGERGTGMGLAIASGLAESFGGSLRVESRLGTGTSVILSFRKAEVPHADADKVKASVAKVDAPTDPKDKALKIMVVDDEQIITDLLSQLLTFNGHEVQAFYDPVDALKAIPGGGFDVVISDRSMPEIKGDDLALEVRRQAPQAKFIMMTGFGDIMVLNSEMPEGVDLILTKPVTRKSIEQALQDLVSGGTAAASSSRGGLKNIARPSLSI